MNWIPLKLKSDFLKPALFVLFVLSTIGCGSGEAPELGEQTFVHTADTLDSENSSELTSDQITQTIKQLILAEGRNAPVYQLLKSQVSKKQDIELAGEIKTAQVSILDSTKKEIFYPSYAQGLSTEAQYFRIGFVFNSPSQYPLSFLLPLQDLKWGQKISLSSEQVHTDFTYKAEINCPNNENNRSCHTLTVLVEQNPKGNTEPAKLRKMGLLFSYGQMYVNTSRALLRPENIHPLTQRLIDREYKDPVLHKLTSMPYGPSLSVLDFSLDQEEKLHIVAPRKKDLDNSQAEVLLGDVVLSSKRTGVTYKVGKAEMAGLEYLPNLDKEFGDFSITIDFLKFKADIVTEESVQISASSLLENIEAERLRQSSELPEVQIPQYLDTKPYFVSPSDETEVQQLPELPEQDSPLVEEEQEEEPSTSRSEPIPTESIPGNSNPPYIRQRAVPDTGAGTLSNIFGVDFSQNKSSNRYKQTLNILRLKNDPYIKNYIDILSTREGGFKYCQSQRKKIARFRCQSLNDKSSCAAIHGGSTTSERSSVQTHLNSLSRLNLEPAVQQIFKYHDVTPLTQNIMYVESRYTTSGDFVIQHNGGTLHPSGNRCWSSALGPHQLTNSTSQEFVLDELFDIGWINNYDLSNMNQSCANYYICDDIKSKYYIFNTPMIQTSGNRCEISYNDQDARTYFVPSTRIITRKNKQALKNFSNNIHYLYWTYHNGETGTSDAIEEAIPEGPSPKTMFRIINQCSDKVGYTATKKCYEQKAAEFGYSSRQFNPTRLFDLSLSKFIDQYNGDHKCTVIEGTLKFLALGIISLSPEEYGFSINPPRVSNESLRMHHPELRYNY